MKGKYIKESYFTINDVFYENRSDDNFDPQTINNPCANPNINLTATKNQVVKSSKATILSINKNCTFNIYLNSKLKL